MATIDLLALSRKPVQQEWEAIAFAFLAVVGGIAILLVFRREEIRIAGSVLIRRNLLGIPTKYPLERVGGMTRRDGRSHLATSDELAAEFPGSVRWVVRHPLVTSGIECAVILVAVLVLVAVADVLRPR